MAGGERRPHGSGADDVHRTRECHAETGAASAGADLAHDLAQVYDRDRDVVVRMAAFVTGDVGAADEIVQDAVADLYAVIDTVDSPSAWRRSAVARRSVSWTRRRITARRYLQAQIGVTGPDVAHTTDVATRTEVRAAVGGLTPQRRAVVFCRFYLDLSEAQTASLLGVPLGTVKSRQARALRELKEALHVG